MRVIRVLTMSGIVLLTACQKSNQADHDVKNIDQQATSTVMVEQATSEAEVEIPASVVVAETQNKTNTLVYPEELVKVVAEAEANCKQPFKVEMSDVVQVIHLLGNRSTEYIYQPDEIICPEDGVFRGHGGDQLVIYTSPDGHKITEIFNSAVFGFEVLKQQSKQVVRVEVGGGYCGQDMSQISRSEAINCKRDLEWDEATQQLEMGEMQLKDKKSEE